MRRSLARACYPYEYVDSPARFEETSLPPREAFYSKLYDESVSQEEYDRAQQIWTDFGIKNMREYHDLYLMTDTLLLADVFENFRKVAKQNYGLDPLHFYTAPGLSLAACLKTTKVELQLFTSPEPLLLCEAGLRGGVSTICQRYSKANNPYVPGYNPNEPSKYIMYLDANNLYGYAMSEPLPDGGFRFLTEEEIAKFDLEAIDENSTDGYILDVDLHYPQFLHSTHNCLPLAAESLPISAEMHSPYAKHLLEKFGRKATGTTHKLCPNLNDKTNYITHYRNLQFYVQMGLVVTKIHKIMAFTQRRWLAPYIELNTQKRMNATSTFEKDFYKLMNNSLFGKTMESLRKRIDVRLTDNQIQAERLVAHPAFENFRINQ